MLKLLGLGIISYFMLKSTSSLKRLVLGDYYEVVDLCRPILGCFCTRLSILSLVDFAEEKFYSSHKVCCLFNLMGPGVELSIGSTMRKNGLVYPVFMPVTHPEVFRQCLQLALSFHCNSI